MRVIDPRAIVTPVPSTVGPLRDPARRFSIHYFVLDVIRPLH